MFGLTCLINVTLQLVCLNQTNQGITRMSFKSLNLQASFFSIFKFLLYLLKKLDHLSCRIFRILYFADLHSCGVNEFFYLTNLLLTHSQMQKLYQFQVSFLTRVLHRWCREFLLHHIRKYIISGYFFFCNFKIDQ